LTLSVVAEAGRQALPDRPPAGTGAALLERFTTRGIVLPRAFVALALLAVALSAGGCATDGRTGSFAQAGGATLTFDSIDGPPPQVFERFVEALSAEAQAKAVPIVSREGTATYRVRAYLAAQISRGRTTIAWTFDVYEAGQQRALRLTGEEPAGRAGRDAWSVADAQLLRRIAQNGMAGVAALMSGTLPADAPVQPAPQLRGPAVADASTPSAGSRTAIAFRSE
jgi:hypothetical protein